MMRTSILVLLCVFVAAAQTTPARSARPARPAAPATATRPQPAETTPAVKPLTVQDVVGLLQAGIGEQPIIVKLQKAKQPVDLQPADMVALKKAGASSTLIAVMMDPSTEVHTPVETAPAPTPAPAPASTPAPAAATPSAQQFEVGVYLKKAGEWMPIPPEIVNWKTGGTIKTLASAGVVKKDLNGNINNPSSRTSAHTPVELLIVATEGVAPEEYQLLRLRINKDYREFRSITGGIMNERSGAVRDLIPFETKKIAPRQFVLVIPPSMGAGEYGLLAPGGGGSLMSISSQGKIYSFHVIE